MQKGLKEKTKYRDRNSQPIHIGQVFDIGQTVNGQSLFYIAELDSNGMARDVRYAHDGSHYEYSLDGFMNDCEEEFLCSDIFLSA